MILEHTGVVAVARALYRQSRRPEAVLALDEPTFGQDRARADDPVGETARERDGA